MKMGIFALSMIWAVKPQMYKKQTKFMTQNKLKLKCTNKFIITQFGVILYEIL